MAKAKTKKKNKSKAPRSRKIKTKKIPKETPETPQDIIFDSKVGKTDALFVDEPEDDRTV